MPHNRALNDFLWGYMASKSADLSAKPGLRQRAWVQGRRLGCF